MTVRQLLGVKLLLACSLLLARPVSAEVPSEVADELRTVRARFVAGPSALPMAKALAHTVEADRDRVALDLGRDWQGVTEIRVAGNELEFRTLLPDGYAVPRWAVGVAFPAENLIVLKATSLQQARETLRHELSHVGIGRLSKTHVPRWFLEGLASVREEAQWAREGVSLAWAARTGQLHAFSSLDRSFPAGRLDAELAYAQSADFVQFLTESASPGAVADVVKAVVAGQSFEAALADATGQSLGSLEARWHQSLLRWDLTLRVLTHPGLLWGLLALFVVFAWFEVRRRRRLRLRMLELEEALEAAHAYDDDPFQPEEGPASLSLPVWDEEGDERREPEPPKKPTLH